MICLSPYFFSAPTSPLADIQTEGRMSFTKLVKMAKGNVLEGVFGMCMKIPTRPGTPLQMKVKMPVELMVNCSNQQAHGHKLRTSHPRLPELLQPFRPVRAAPGTGEGP